MGSILHDYLNKRLGILDLQKELQTLISSYNRLTGHNLFVYASDFSKARNGADVSLIQEDFYIIQDFLRESDKKAIDFYIETPGGSGEAAEEIARFLRKKFEEVNFIIAGEAKSAGTILALSGDNIYMADTGSLGPIDAQVRIGRTTVSAHDYKEWVELKRKEANTDGKLNPFDAVIVAQISPGELSGIVNSLEFAKDLVKEWLEKFKFKNWTETRTKKRPVDSTMRKQRAHEVAEMLCNHTEWRTHGRSLKIDDLKDVLLIERIDDNKDLADIVYRIKTVIRLIFDSSSMYKLFFSEELNLGKTVVNPNQNFPISPPPSPPSNTVDAAELEIECPKCKKMHKVTAYFDITSIDIAKRKLKVNSNVNDRDILVCDSCTFALDLKPIKNQLETQSKRKINFK